MDKATLVTKDQQIQQIRDRVAHALSQAKIPVTLVQCDYVSEYEEWQPVKVVIGTPLRDPRKVYSRVIEALQQEGLYEEVPMLRVSVLSPDDRVVKALEQEVKNQTEGNIHILAHNPKKPDQEKTYSVIFAPFAGPGGFVPRKHLAGRAELREFLQDSLRIKETSVEEALLDLERKGDTSIFNVQLTNKERKKHGLG